MYTNIASAEWPGAVVLLVINNDPEASHVSGPPNGSTRYSLDAAKLQDVAVRLNGTPLDVDAAGQLPNLTGIPTGPGAVIFALATITFLTISDAGNRHSQQPPPAPYRNFAGGTLETEASLTHRARSALRTRLPHAGGIRII